MNFVRYEDDLRPGLAVDGAGSREQHMAATLDGVREVER